MADNIASDCGGAVYIDYGAFPSFDACTISGNASTGNGGGIAIDYMGRYVNMIDSSTITNNRSTSGEDDIDDDRSMGTLQSPMEM